MRNRMAMQNIYDNEIFFEDFKKKRINSTINFNDCIETPILLAMLPDLHGKSILDIGCGMGQHAKQYSDKMCIRDSSQGLRIESLAMIESMSDDGTIIFRK